MEILKNAEFDQHVRRKGEAIFKLLEAESGSIFNKDWWYGKIMDWSMRDEKFKTQMFRFVDVLPYLNSSGEVARHMKEYFKDADGQFSQLMTFGAGLGALAPGLLAGAVRKNITQMAKMFITGENPQTAIPLLRKGRDNNLGFTVDLLGEATLSEKEALEYQSRYVELIDWLVKDSAKWPENPLLDQDDRGAIPKVNVSVKLTALYSQISDKAWEESVQILKERLRPLFTLGKERGIFINVDMEQYKYKAMTFQVFKELLMEPEFIGYPHFGIVVQAYLRDSLADVNDLIAFARARNTPLTIRLVKGAYWDYETIFANQQNWPVPVYVVKRESDANYERCALALLQNAKWIKLAAGTHNVRTIAAVMTMAEQLKLDPRSYEIQMLFGMAEPIKKALVKQNVRVREYATVGELIPGMAYLVRRLLENTSNESFLKSKFADNASTELLLRNPGEGLNGALDAKPKAAVMTGTSTMGGAATTSKPIFYNEPLLDFGVKANRDALRTAMNDFERKLGETYPILISGKKIISRVLHSRENPSQPSQVVGKISMASQDDAEAAVQAAHEYFAQWKKVSIDERVTMLRKMAALMRRDRFKLIAIEIFETGKPWSEADGDIAEAIDFCEYYADEMERIGVPERVSFVGGESSFYEYQPRGVTLVIAPWNFPLAILCGMTVSALVTGNTVVVKPAEQSSVIAYEMMRLLYEAGVPTGAAHFVPGYGEEIGRYLVNHKNISLISFTGSRAVGLEIVRAAATVAPGQRFVKKAIIEMGGKNAIIIDSDADLDEAVQGVVYSAFGYAGQKCSACSRVIVLEENYDRFLGRLVEATKSLTVRDARDPHAYLGPVVDGEAHERILSTIKKYQSDATVAGAGKGARLLFTADVPKEGYFVGPTIFADVDPKSALAQEEIFGPVVAVIKAKDLDEALAFANDSQYALTGGLYSRSPANIEKVKREFECGNLYVNRGITGAMVGRHPFGGHKLSGLGSKTGGKDYLLSYVEPRVVTENTIRRGFAPVEGE